VGVVVEALEEALAHVLVDERVMCDLASPGVELLGGGQLAVEQQVGHLQIGRVLGQLLDRVAAVQQDAGLSVDIADRALAGGGHCEAGIVEPDAGEELRPGAGRHSAVLDGNLHRFAGSVVGDGDAVCHQA